MKIIEYDHLITHTSFNFKNRKKEAEYWDNLLMDSPLRFKNEYSQFLHEKLHVIFSFSQIFKYFALGCSVLFLFSVINNSQLLLVNGLASLIFFGLHIGYYMKFVSFAIAVAVTDEINSVEFIEKLRDLIIEEKRKTKSLI